jgi:hypothetical protein
MISVADIKSDLPNWPNDVIDDWLLYFANEPNCGWPPPEPLGDHRWAGILGDRPLSWWRDVTWSKESVKCGLDNLSPKSRGIAATMIVEISGGTADALTKRRYQQALQHILESGTFFGPIVAMKRPNGLLVLDGNHRISAFCGLRFMPEVWFVKLGKTKPPPEQEAWIGARSDGEGPLT